MQQLQHRPSYLTTEDDNFNFGELRAPASGAPPTISIKGGKFTAKAPGREPLILPDDTGRSPAKFFEFVILGGGGEGKISKTYYEGEFIEKESTGKQPTCFSLDGIKPDNRSITKQNDKCQGCPKNEFNTARVGKGKACKDKKLIAVVPNGDILNRGWGGPMIIRLPPTSFKPLNEYIQKIALNKMPPHLIVTRISFDPEATQPRLLFEPVSWLSAEDAELSRNWRKSDQLHQLLTAVESVGDGEDEDHEAAPVATHAPTQTADTRAAAEAVAEQQQAEPEKKPAGFGFTPMPQAEPVQEPAKPSGFGKAPPAEELAKPSGFGKAASEPGPQVKPNGEIPSAAPIKSNKEKMRELLEARMREAEELAKQLDEAEEQEKAAASIVQTTPAAQPGERSAEDIFAMLAEQAAIPD